MNKKGWSLREEWGKFVEKGQSGPSSSNRSPPPKIIRESQSIRFDPVKIKYPKKKLITQGGMFVGILLFLSAITGIFFGFKGYFLGLGISLLVFLILLHFVTIGTRYRSVFNFFVITLIILFVIFIPSTSYGQNNITPWVENTKNRIGDLGFLGFLKDAINPSDVSEYGNFENKEYEEEGIGVSLSYPEATQSRFDPGQGIVIYSYLDAGTLSDSDSIVKVLCDMDGYLGDSESKPESISLPARGDNLVNQRVECRFLDGLKDDRTQTRDAKIIVQFEEFYGESVYPLLFVSSTNDEDIKPAEYIKGTINWYNAKGIGNSEVSPGPSKLVLGIGQPQPFTAGDKDLNLEVTIESNDRVNFIGAKRLQLYVPRDSIKLQLDDPFCDFELTGFDGRHEIYEPRQAVYEDLNKVCKTSSCYREKRVIHLNCFFDIDENFVSGNEVLQDTMGINMLYSFELSRTTSVTVEALKEEDLDIV